MDLKFFMLDPGTFRADFARSGPRYKNPFFFFKDFQSQMRFLQNFRILRR